ncbi:LysM peptidoglycan-binding domain-containing protein [Nocardioidaceae bacterium]|nr:LysM peptidoglycan-binding domain-containing protein [Nocardioidaceae bacterium]
MTETARNADRALLVSPVLPHVERYPMSPLSHSIRPQLTSSSVSLTRRGRLAVTLTLLSLLVLALVLTAGRSEATDEGGSVLPTRTVTVSSGDTLWDIAAEVAEPGDTQATVIEIQRLNSLASVSLAVGQRLEVPLG